MMPSSQAMMAQATGYCLIIRSLNSHSHFRNRFIYRSYLVIGKAGNDPRRSRMRQQKFRGVGRAEICQLTSAGSLRKTIFDTFLYPILSLGPNPFYPMNYYLIDMQLWTELIQLEE